MYTCILLYKMDCPLPQIPNTHPSGVFGTFPQLYTNLKTTCSGSQSQLLTNASSLIGQLDIKSTWFFFSLSYSSSKSYSPLLDTLSSYHLHHYCYHYCRLSVLALLYWLVFPTQVLKWSSGVWKIAVVAVGGIIRTKAMRVQL